MKKIILIIGAPGSGKTTDAQVIAKNNEDSFVHFSTGDLLRAEVTADSELGRVIDGFVSKGNLVPLDIVVDTIVHAIENTTKNIILIDGYPRSVEQMSALDERLRDNAGKMSLVSVIEVEVSQEVAKERVLGRARGSDDKVEVFNNRMEVYIKPLKAIQDFYTGKNLFHKINGERGIEEIVQEMESFIKSKI